MVGGGSQRWDATEARRPQAGFPTLPHSSMSWESAPPAPLRVRNRPVYLSFQLGYFARFEDLKLVHTSDCSTVAYR